MRGDRVLAAPVAEDVPGDLWRTADDETEAPDVLAVVARRGREDGAPSKREAPEPKDLRARSVFGLKPQLLRRDARMLAESTTKGLTEEQKAAVVASFNEGVAKKTN